MQTPLSCIPTKRIEAWELQGKLAWQANFGDLSALNLGYAGDRTEHVLWRLTRSP